MRAQLDISESVLASREALPCDRLSHRPWAADERAWARESLSAGDPISEIASACERGILETARELGVYGWRPRSLRWQKSEPGRPRQWIGGMLREVAIARCRAGEDPKLLALEAQVSVYSMRDLCRGICSVRPERRQSRWAA